MVSASFTQETVETEGLLTILGQGEVYNMAKRLLRADTLTFTPSRMMADADRARRDLDEAIRVMAAGPEIEAGLAEATRRVMADMTEDSLAAQQRALRSRAEHLQRLSELAQPQDIV
jgi:DNA primase